MQQVDFSKVRLAVNTKRFRATPWSSHVRGGMEYESRTVYERAAYDDRWTVHQQLRDPVGPLPESLAKICA